MLGVYFKSCIIWFIIMFTTFKVCRSFAKARQEKGEINYYDYADRKSFVNFYLTAFIPILRIIVIILYFFVTFAKKETLDDLLLKK